MPMQTVPTMNGADTRVRAAIGVLFGANQITNPPYDTFVSAKTANYTITAAEIAKAFSNLGAGGAVILTLPVPFAGAFLWVFKQAAQNLTCTAAAGTTINGAATWANTTAGDSGKGLALLIGVSPTVWMAMSVGTWA